MKKPPVVPADAAALRRRAEQKLQKQPAESPAKNADVRKLLHELQVRQIELEMQNEELRQARTEVDALLARYTDLYDFAPVGYLTLDHDCVIDEINITGAKLLGVERNKLPRRHFTPFVATEDSDRWHRHFQNTLKSDDALTCDLALLRGDASHFYARLDCLRLVKTAETTIVRVTLIDITECKQAEAELRITSSAFESLESMVITDLDGVILKVNRAFTKATGYTAEEAIGQTPRLLNSGRQDADFYREMWGTLLRTGKWQGEIWDRRKNGEIYPKLLTISAVKGDDGVVTHYVGTDYDITNRKATEEEINRLAFYDSLTQLPNRRLLNDRLDKTMATSKRSSHYGALLFLDLDNFKPLNDTHGHSVGDLLLVEVAHRIAHCVREIDTVARFGGDEFVVVLSELDKDKAESAAQAGIVAEKIRTTLAEPYVLKIQPEGKVETTVEHHCTASIGVVLFIGHEASAEDILRWADTAMYQAKEAGRNQTRFYEPEV